MFGQFKRIMVGMVVLTLAITPSLVSACGGFFGPANLSVDLNSFRVAFSISKDHTITEIVGVNYTGSAADFSWVMPLPAIPTVDVTDQLALDYLETYTDPSANYPINYCSDLNDTLIQTGGYGGGGGGGTIGAVGPYDYAIIKNRDPGQMVKWLRDNGYTIKASDEPIINQYVREGNAFVAMKLRPGEDVQDIQPVVFKYQSSKITIPVRLGAVASLAMVPILTWIFSDAQYAPTNYARVDRPSLSGTRDFNETVNIGGVNEQYNYTSWGDIYDRGATAIQNKYQGHAFITEYAAPTKDLITDLDSPEREQLLNSTGSALQTMLTTFPYVTRLRAQLSPDQMTLDPLFAPLANAADVVQATDLSKVVDPLTLNGCTTQAALDPRIAAEFATSHTTFSDLRFDIGHPTNWVLSQFTTGYVNNFFAGPDSQSKQTVYVYAPQPVTANTINTYFAGGLTPPMFVFVQVAFGSPGQLQDEFNMLNAYDGSNIPSLAPLLAQVLGQKAVPPNLFQDHRVQASVWPYHGLGADVLTLFNIFASPSQWQANKTLFDDMLSYARAHQYFTGADTKDTLFLSVKNMFPENGSAANNDVYSLPIPNGWTAKIDGQNDIMIAPDKAADNGDGPAMRLTLMGNADTNTRISYTYFGPLSSAHSNQDGYVYPAASVKRAMSFYGLPGSPNDPAIIAVTQHCAFDPNVTLKVTPVPFHSGGRTGLVALTDEYIVGVYAPDAEYSQDQATLQKMMDAYVAGYQCGINVGDAGILNATETPGPSPTATPIICPKSPVPRLVIDGKGVVTPGAPDNLRSAPSAEGAILAQIPAGGQFTVLDGPDCDSASGLAWWQVKFNGQTGWLAEGQGQTYFVSPVGITGQVK